jgi:hypothetical protein
VRRDGSANGSAIAMDGGSDKTFINLVHRGSKAQTFGFWGERRPQIQKNFAG